MVISRYQVTLSQEVLKLILSLSVDSLENRGIIMVSNDTSRRRFLYMPEDNSRIESRQEVAAFLSKLKYALDNGAKITFEAERFVDKNRDITHTNKYTLATLFPDQNPVEVLKTELYSLTIAEYMRTVSDTRCPERGEMREFGRVYNSSQDVYIKVRVELFSDRYGGDHTAFVMSFHFALVPFSDADFPYRE